MAEGTKCLEGKLLLADARLHNGIFGRSVVLILKHNQAEGAWGLVLNKPSEQKVGQLMTDEDFKAIHSLPVFSGGPVATNQLIFAVFWWGEDQGLRYLAQVSLQQAIERHRQPGALVRAFVGYSGWEAGQLEEELERSAWIVADPPTSLLAIDHGEQMWSDVLREMGPFFKVLAEIPVNPELN